VRNLVSGDSDLLTMDALAMALAMQGEDGAGELLPLLRSDDFTIRHMAAVGLGLLDRSGRWAVPALIQALSVEDQPLIVTNLVTALGRIGGQAAILGLSGMLDRLRSEPDLDGERFAMIEEGLRAAIAGSLLDGSVES
jgi:HEAT repeat protein